MSRRLMFASVALLLVAVVIVAIVLLSRPDPGPGAFATPTGQAEADQFAALREKMVYQQIEQRRVSDQAVLDAMGQVPRHEFVPSEHGSSAYADHPLPIGYGQTISQPYIVAIMTEALQVQPGDRILEVGTGSGYQAAVLAEMGAQVFTVEIVPELAEQAATRLDGMGYTNVEVQQADGYYGWEAHAPFDAIIVTAAPDHLPQPLANQLEEGGRLVVPIGPPGAVQTLWLFEKQNGELLAGNLGEVRFVPLTGEGR